jgi:glycerol-1-phosphate dehydrogenase [NAD(P)+]
MVTGILGSTGAEVFSIGVARDDTRALEKAVYSIKKNQASLCIGIGGGRVLDVAKFACFSGNIPFVSFPLLLSHDGIASPVAVIHDGKKWSESRTAASPLGVIVDLETVAREPKHSILSGISDLTANLFASLDVELAGAEHGGGYDSLATAIARSASQLVFPRFQEYSLDSPSVEQMRNLAWGLILSGIAMSIAGSSRPASGAEHKISHAIDYLCPVPVSHGFTVSVGNVISAFLHGHYQKEIILFNTSLGLPVIGDDIGIGKADFVKVMLHARTIRPDRYTILEEKNLTRSAIDKLLDRIAATRKSVVTER